MFEHAPPFFGLMPNHYQSFFSIPRFLELRTGQGEDKLLWIKPISQLCKVKNRDSAICIFTLSWVMVFFFASSFNWKQCIMIISPQDQFRFSVCLLNFGNDNRLLSVLNLELSVALCSFPVKPGQTETSEQEGNVAQAGSQRLHKQIPVGGKCKQIWVHEDLSDGSRWVQICNGRGMSPWWTAYENIVPQSSLFKECLCKIPFSY